MVSRKMKHPGTATMKRAAVTATVFDPETCDYVEKVITPETEFEAKLPDGVTYGGFPVGKEVSVPRHLQGPLHAKGFRFVKADDEKAFQKEEKVIEEAKKAKAAREAKAAEVATATAPVEDIPAESNEGGK